MCVCDRDSNWVCVQHKVACAIRKPRGFCDCGLAAILVRDGVAVWGHFSGSGRDGWEHDHSRIECAETV